MLPRDMPEYSVGLGQLDLSVDVVGQVREVQPQRVLDIEPAGLVEGWGLSGDVPVDD